MAVGLKRKKPEVQRKTVGCEVRCREGLDKWRDCFAIRYKSLSTGFGPVIIMVFPIVIWILVIFLSCSSIYIYALMCAITSV